MSYQRMFEENLQGGRINDGSFFHGSLSNVRTDSYENAMADLTRQQWNDFRNRFLPVQNELIGLAQSDDLLNEQLARNQSNINNSFAIAKQNEANRMHRFGLTPKQSQQDDNNNNLLKSLTNASITNETRGAVKELKNKIMTGQGQTPKSLAQIGQ